MKYFSVILEEDSLSHWGQLWTLATRVIDGRGRPA